MARSLTDEVDQPKDKDEVDLKQLADMLYAIFCAVQEINAKLPEPAKQDERPVNGL